MADVYSARGSAAIWLTFLFSRMITFQWYELELSGKKSELNSQ
jgi:hypothetical protein